MRHGLYLHPWDFADRDDLAALVATGGYADVAMAASYHAGRWLTPGSSGRVRFLEDGVVHFRPGPCYSELAPVASSEVPERGPSPLERLVADARALGVRSYAWTVLFHNSRLGALHPQSCVENAFGDSIEYALCPARPEVRAYGLRLAADIAGHGVDCVELEAVGWMGYKHGSHHDKASFKADAALDFALSYCFCSECRRGLDERGVDADAVAAVAREYVDSVVCGDAMSPCAGGAGPATAEVFGDGVLEVMLLHRTATYREFLIAVADAVADGVELALHVRADPLFTGSQMGARLDDVARLVDEMVYTHYGEAPERIAAHWGSRRVPAGRCRLAVWPKAPEFDGGGSVRAACEVAERVGCDGLRIYHASLLPALTLREVGAALRGD